MKILVIPSWYPPQGGFFFEEQVFELAKLGHDITVIYTSYNSLKTFSFNNKIEIEQNEITTWRNKYWKLPRLYKYNQKKYIKKHSQLVEKYFKNTVTFPDVIFGQSMLWGGYIASKFSKKHNIPLVIQEQRGRFNSDNNYSNNLLKKWMYPYIKNALEQTEELILLNESMKTTVYKIAPKVKSKFSILGNMVDTDFFILKEKYLVNDSMFKFICVARLDEFKGIDIILKAASILAKTHKNFEVEILGEGEMKNDFIKLAYELNISKHISFKGQKNREEVRIELQKSDAFILPTRFEAFGISCLEAISTGLPVIVSNVGAFPDFINEKNGILCPIDNVEAFAEAMIYMIENYQNYNAEQIRNTAVNYFSKKVIIKKLENILIKASEYKN